MICVACNNPESYENIAKWKVEIMSIEEAKPIVLILTKKDLGVQLEAPVTIEALR